MLTQKQKEGNFDFKIGADPEFNLTLQGRKVDARQTMEYMLDRKKEFKSINGMGFQVEEFGNIGWDGASSTAEIRPAPSYNPKEVVTNLNKIFKAFTKYVNVFDMSTLSEFSSVGGHVHLEIPNNEKWSAERKNTLHRKIASFYLPILISENKTNLNLRIKQGYGSIRDSHLEQKGKTSNNTQCYTYEFRCPSAEWLTTPKIAEATLSYLAVVYHEIIKHPKNFAKFNDLIYKSEKQGDALQSLAIMEFSLLTDSILNKTKKYIKTFEMYPVFKEQINYILNPKQVIKDKNNANYNIIEGWNLITQDQKPRKSDILASKKKIQTIAKEKDFDQLKKIMSIHYNDDTNVALFAENLKDRVAAFNWKLKNTYYIFGMRKGINSILAKNLKDEFIAGKNLIKTIKDNEEVLKLFRKMNNKFLDNNQALSITTIDFKTGKPRDTRENSIIIGLPYDMRINEDIKPFLSFIWTLEKGEAIESNKEEAPLIDDRNLPLDQTGEIYKILTKQIPETVPVMLDQGSTSLRNNTRAMAMMAMESINESAAETNETQEEGNLYEESDLYAEDTPNQPGAMTPNLSRILDNIQPAHSALVTPNNTIINTNRP